MRGCGMVVNNTDIFSESVTFKGRLKIQPVEQ